MYSRIRHLREDADKSQSELAQMLCVSQTTYSRYENGVFEIPVQSLVLLARIYNTSIDYLVGLTDEKMPYSRTKHDNV